MFEDETDLLLLLPTYALVAFILLGSLVSVIVIAGAGTLLLTPGPMPLKVIMVSILAICLGLADTLAILYPSLALWKRYRS